MRGTVYTCQACEYRTGKWLGRCPECGTWDGLVEHAPPPATAKPAVRVELRSYPEIDSSEARRLSSGIGELDRVLGGGLVPGAVVLIGGEPGIGKSTLLLQAASAMAGSGAKVIYASAEESAAQLRSRGERLGVVSAGLLVAAETDVDGLIEAARSVGPAALVVDSVQAVRCGDLGAAAGSVTQVREAASRLVKLAKSRSLPVLLVGHVTKEGWIAGPRSLEHIVDTVIQFEGDRHHEHRILRALKNRFGTTDELGVFRMAESGLEEIANPSELLLSERRDGVPGSAVLAAMVGTRPLLLEIQALVGPPMQGSPRRTSLGVDSNRVALVLAVLQRQSGIELAQRDVFVNVTGGLAVSEPAADLAIAAAVTSSALGRPLPERTMIAGEIGLAGEVRAVSRLETRLREAVRLGFDCAVLPRSRSALGAPGARIEAVERVDAALSSLFGAEAVQIG